MNSKKCKEKRNSFFLKKEKNSYIDFRKNLEYRLVCRITVHDCREEGGVRLDSQEEIKSVRKNEGYKVCV